MNFKNSAIKTVWAPVRIYFPILLIHIRPNNPYIMQVQSRLANTVKTKKQQITEPHRQSFGIIKMHTQLSYLPKHVFVSNYVP